MGTETETETETTTTEKETETPPPEETDWKAEAEKWKGLSRQHEQRAKANGSAAKELEKLKQSSLPEQERAIAEAKAAAKVEALAEVGVARAEDAIRFSVGDRVPNTELDALLEDLNLAKFVKEDGSVDREKVTRYVERIAPTGKNKPDLGQGARGSAKGGGGSFLTDAIKNRHR